MKYRVRLDLSFDDQHEADLLNAYAKGKADKANSINEGTNNEEISYVDYEICRHDEGRPCTKVERKEVRKTGNIVNLFDVT